MAATQVRAGQIKDGDITHDDIATANKDGVAATASMRTLGTGAQQAAAGNHSHAYSELTNVTTLRLLGRTTAGTGVAELITAAFGNDLVNGVLKGSFVNFNYTELSGEGSTTSAIPFDGTLPQNTEGTEILTAAITPEDSSNYLIILFFAPVHAINTTPSTTVFALFKDSGADAVTAGSTSVATANLTTPMFLAHVATAGGTSSQTWKVRYGPTSGAITSYINRTPGQADLFSTAARCCLLILEVRP